MDDLVRDVLERLHDTLGDVVHVLLLDPVERTVVADDRAPDDVLAGARALVTALAAVVGPQARAAAIVETSTSTLYATHRSGGLAVVLVGPTSWNVALARRTADPLLDDLLTPEVTRRVRTPPSPARGAVPAATPAAGTSSAAAAPGGTRAQALRADAVRHVPRSA